MSIKTRYTVKKDIIALEDYLAQRGYVLQFTKGEYEVIRAQHVATKSKIIVYANGKGIISFRDEDYIDFEDLLLGKDKLLYQDND